MKRTFYILTVSTLKRVKIEGTEKAISYLNDQDQVKNMAAFEVTSLKNWDFKLA